MRSVSIDEFMVMMNDKRISCENKDGQLFISIPIWEGTINIAITTILSNTLPLADYIDEED